MHARPFFMMTYRYGLQSCTFLSLALLYKDVKQGKPPEAMSRQSVLSGVKVTRI